MATLKGQSDEVIFLTTQTDGPNECNENGGLGVLALATYWSKVPAANRRRTIVASFPTAHYAAGAVMDPVTGSGRRGGTGGVLAKWPAVASRIVGQISLEQMGAMEWVDLNGKFVATGNVAGERWIATPATEAASARMFMAATVGEDPKYSNAACVHEQGAPGEGGSLRSRGLPGIGLMGQPGYFFRCDPNGVLDKLNPERDAESDRLRGEDDGVDGSLDAGSAARQVADYRRGPVRRVDRLRLAELSPLRSDPSPDVGRMPQAAVHDFILV